MIEEKLRDEIIESEKARGDLIKWKLILVAAIGSVGLGLGSNATSMNNPTILLALIPLVCLYVDMVCYHNELRILIIGRFLRTGASDQTVQAYEQHAKNSRLGFSLEATALLAATVVVCALVVLVGIFNGLPGLFQNGVSAPFVGWVLIASGACAGVTSGILYLHTKKTGKALDKPEEPGQVSDTKARSAH